MNRHLLVFENSHAELNLQDFVESLDTGAQMYALDDHVCFLKTALSASDVSDRFLQFFGSGLFFAADITSSECAGRMFGSFWDFMKPAALPTAAE